MDIAAMDNSNKRLSVSFTTVVTLHIIFFWLLSISSSWERQKETVIAGVELFQMEPAVVQPVTPVKTESIWTRIRNVLPVGGGGDGGKSSRIEKPLDTMTRLVEQVTYKTAEKLIDRKMPIAQSNKKEIDNLKMLREEKLKDLIATTGGQMHKITQMMAQEQTLSEQTKPLARGTNIAALPIQEVGATRDRNIADIANTEASRREEKIGDIGIKQLVERKGTLKRQLAALGVGGVVSDRSATSTSKIIDVVGSLQERQKVQEVLALQKRIDQQSPREGPPDNGGPGGGGGYGGGFGGGYGSGYGGGIGGAGGSPNGGKISLNDTAPICRPIEKTTIANPSVLAKMKQISAGQGAGEAHNSPIQISGPISKRKVLSAFIPQYPDWARKKGIEADVSLRLFVNPQGNVLPDIFVNRTSGYSDFDTTCIETLRRWVFAPLSSGEPQKDQWGIITIRFRLE